jgi:hypothetical protein
MTTLLICTYGEGWLPSQARTALQAYVRCCALDRLAYGFEFKLLVAVVGGIIWISMFK